jgi:hypothetical protein
VLALFVEGAGPKGNGGRREVNWHKEVGLEGLNGLLGSIATMYVGRDKLVSNLPLVHYGGLEFGADFIVKDLEISVMPMVGEVAHDGVVGGQLVFIGPVDIRGTEDHVALAVVGNGDVLVAAASPDGESTHVVSVELGKREACDVELVSRGQCGGLVNGIFWFISSWCIRCGK